MGKDNIISLLAILTVGVVILAIVGGVALISNGYISSIKGSKCTVNGNSGIFIKGECITK